MFFIKSFKYKGEGLVLIATILWGMLGAIVNFIKSYGLNAHDIAFIRLFFATIIIGLFILYKDFNLFKVKGRNLLFYLIIGLVSQGLFNLFYFTSIVRIGITAGVIMLYTAPAFTLILSRIFLKSKLKGVQVIAIITTFLGSILTVSGGTFHGINFDIIGIIAGLLAGACYGALPVFNRSISANGNNYTIIFYSFLAGSIVILPLANTPMILETMFNNHSVFFMGIILGFFPTIVSHFTFLEASKTLEAFKISIIANFEVVVATSIAFLFYGEDLGLINMIGIILVIVGATIPNIVFKKGMKKGKTV